MTNYTFDLASVDRADPVYYPKSVLFDFEKGDFVLNGKGDLKMIDSQGACEAWCRKAINIERYSKLSYSKNLGIEFEQVQLYEGKEARESWLKRTITEAVLADPKQRIQSVDSFTFEYPEPDVVMVYFIVTLKNDVSFGIKQEIKNG